jgi:uncharacterized caspase-like protein
MARRIALVVGVSRYTHMPHLPAAAVDADQVAALLADRGEFEVTKLQDPDHQELGRALEDFYGNKSLLTKDTLLLYFAGHGIATDDRDRFYLATTDTDPHYAHSSAVDAELIKHHLNNTGAKAKVILLDSCFSGLMGEGLRSRGDGLVGLKAPLDRKGTFVLTATDRTSYAFEDLRSEGQSALFTAAVVEAMSGGATDTDGDDWVSIQDIAHYVLNSETVTAKQKPLAYSHSVNGAIPLVRAQGRTPDPDPVPAAASRLRRPEPQHDPHAPLDGATWQKLLRYYVACLKREAGLSDWFHKGETGRARIWGGGAEQVFTGPVGPVRLPEPVAMLCKDDEAAYSYGYPLVLLKDGRRAKYAPLLTTALTVSDGTAEAGTVELNTQVLEELGLEAGEIEQLCQHVVKQFRPGDPDHLAALVQMIADSYEVPVIGVLDPTRLADNLRDSPIVEGIQNLGVVWRDDGTQATVRGLIKDLGTFAAKEVGKFGSTALAALADRDDRPVASMPQLVTLGPLNEAQEAVVEAAMTRRLTVATGPPGTGKTALVTAVCATAEAAGQSVLVASTNHRAVDNVREKLDSLAPGMIIRTGPRRILDEEPGVLGRLLDSVETPPQDGQILEGRLRLGHKRISELRALIDAHCDAEADLYAVHRHLDRLESDADARVRSALELDDRRLERAAVRAGRSLRRWPFGILARRLVRSRYGADSPTDRGRLVEIIDTEKFRRERTDALEALPDAAPLWAELQQHLDTRVTTGRDYSRLLAARRLRAGEGAIRARIERMNRDDQGANWKDFRNLLRPLPGWAVNGHSSTAIVPTPALFDLVVIDEAAQCATPHVLALLMRAKRALIIGDPNQLQPVIQLGKDGDEDLRRAAGLGREWMQNRHLGFTDESIYSACAAATDEELLLDEHYRCDPEIVAAPNRVVYQNRLTVLTDRSSLRLPADPPDSPAVEVIDVRGFAERPQSGSCRNPVEAEQAVEYAARVAADDDELTIGIVTPFKAQERMLDVLLRRRGIRDRVVVGTIHTFQGGECDVIVLSPVAADGIAPRSADWVRGETNLWNVAITRAMSRLVVVCDRTWWAGKTGLLSQLIDASEREPEVQVGVRDLVDRLQYALERVGGAELKRGAMIAGQSCDLVIEGDPGTALVVDAAPAPDGKRHRQQLARLDLIAAAGYRPIRVAAWRILADPDLVARELFG